MTLIAAIDWNSLFESVAGSLVAGVGIVLAFSIGLRGLIRASELHADGHGVGATIAAAIGTLGLLLAITGTVVGLVIVAGNGPGG